MNLPVVDDADYELAPGDRGARRGFDHRHRRRVVLKCAAPGGEDALLREARLTARLQHAAIVPVYETARFSDGALFVAMMDVAGETLAARLAAGDGLALLPRVRAVADALAYAHEHGVVHGALTADKILLGDHGETLVSDWSAAREAGDPRDDVVACAALVSALDGPAELAAIAQRAAARGYADAGEVSAELARFAAGELVQAFDYSTATLLRRWLRRRRRAVFAALFAVVVVAAAGVVALAQVTAQRDRAVAAQAGAEGLGASGDALVTFLLDIVVDRLDFQWQSRTVADLTGEVLAYYAAVAETRVTDAEALDRRWDALAVLSEAAGDRGDKARRAEVAAAALDVLAEHARRFGATPSVVSRRAYAKMFIADAEFFQRGATPAVAVVLADAVGEAELAVALSPDGRGGAMAVLNARSAMCNTLLGEGAPPAAARDQLLVLRDQVWRALARWPVDPFGAYAVWVETRLAEAHLRLADFDAAAVDTANALVRQTVYAVTGTRGVTYLSRIHSLFAEVALGRGDPELALAHALTAAALVVRVVGDDVQNAEIAVVLARARRDACAAHLDAGRPAPAAEACAAAVATLARIDGDTLRVLDMRARAQETLAEALLAAGRPAGEAASAAVETYRGLVHLPGAARPSWLVGLAHARVLLAASDGSAASLAAAHVSTSLVEAGLRAGWGDVSLAYAAAAVYARLGDTARAVEILGDPPPGRARTQLRAAEVTGRGR